MDGRKLRGIAEYREVSHSVCRIEFAAKSGSVIPKEVTHATAGRFRHGFGDAE